LSIALGQILGVWRVHALSKKTKDALQTAIFSPPDIQTWALRASTLGEHKPPMLFRQRTGEN
jgi:hypothetical protein